MVVRWIFTDLTTSATQTFYVNPSDESFPGWEKQTTYKQTTAPDGNTLVFQGQDKVREGGFSGVLTTEAEFNMFQTWYEKRNQVRITDDLGRQHTVIMESFKPKRRRSSNHPWAHTYEVTYTVLG